MKTALPRGRHPRALPCCEPLLLCYDYLGDWFKCFEHSNPWPQAREEAKVAAALRAATAALLAKHNGAIRSAGVSCWEFRLRVPDASGAWRVVASCPTGAASLLWSACFPRHVVRTAVVRMLHGPLPG